MYRENVSYERGLLASPIITLFTGERFNLFVHNFLMHVQGFVGLELFPAGFTHEYFVAFMFFQSVSSEASLRIESHVAQQASEFLVWVMNLQA